MSPQHIVSEIKTLLFTIWLNIHLFCEQMNYTDRWPNAQWLLLLLNKKEDIHISKYLSLILEIDNNRCVR